MATTKHNTKEQVMEDTVREFVIDWQCWASQQNLSYSELAQWTDAIRMLASAVDDDGELIEELKENGVI